jgi:hypothetical protein
VIQYPPLKLELATDVQNSSPSLLLAAYIAVPLVNQDIAFVTIVILAIMRKKVNLYWIFEGESFAFKGLSKELAFEIILLAVSRKSFFIRIMMKWMKAPFPSLPSRSHSAIFKMPY